MEVLRTEYPRPDFVREEWQSLNGTWDFAFDDERVISPRLVQFTEEIRVPFPFQAKLSGIGDSQRTTPVVWYRRSFEIPSNWEGRQILLHFGAVDYETFVWVNGEFVGCHKGGYVPFSFDITAYLADGENELIVKVIDENKASQPRGKQSANYDNWACWYTRVTGIWQSVWLEPVAKAHIKRIRLHPDIDNECLLVNAELSEILDGAELRITSFFQGVRQATVNLPIERKHYRNCDLHPRAEHRAVLPVSEPRLWSPEKPNLYDLTLELLVNGEVVDSVKTYFGMRKVEARGNKIYLNNEPYYLRMVLDQGFWPDGIYTPGSVDEIKKDVDLIKAAGFNGVRKHQKIEDPYFYHYCAQVGLLVWAEMPSAYNYDEYNVANVMAEWQQVVRRLYNFPSIMAWVPMNESWGVEQLETTPNDSRLWHHLDSLYNATKALDPHRLVISNDGWEMGQTDIIAIHEYTPDSKKLARLIEAFRKDPHGKVFTHRRPIILPEYEYEGQPILVTEYGGVKVEEPGVAGWGYGQPARDLREMLSRMRELTDTILAQPDICGYCYTQLTDVQQEVNGLYTFEREHRASPEDYAAIFGRNPENWGGER
ncbi:MAG: glycoside hydrolase family 2 protein [Limnochordia bacterium]